MIGITRIGISVALLGALASFAASPSAFAQEADKDKPAPAAAPGAPMVESIKILFDDKAKNDGVLLLTFTPQGGEAKEIRVTIAAKMGKKEAAEDTAKELKVALGAGYDVDNYDSDKIKVAGKKGAKFSLTISSLTANGLSVRLK